MEEIINMCPHDIHLYDDNKKLIKTFPKTGKELRLVEAPPVLSKTEDGIPIATPPKYTGLTIPINMDSEVLVSQLVANYLVEHNYKMKGIYTPDTGPSGSVRSDKGEIIGTKRLIKYL